MWKVVGIKKRVKNDRTYVDLFITRPCPGGEGQEARALNYPESYIPYKPVLGDTVMFSMGVYNGRQYVQDIQKLR